MNDQPTAEVAVHIDARDLICPLPVLKARKALKGMASGDVLEVVATDPAAPADFQAFCESTEHQLVGTEMLDDGAMRFLIARG